VVATRRSSLGREEAGALQGEQHLLEVPLRDRLTRGDRLDGREAALTMKRQIEHRLDRVLSLRRDAHAATQLTPRR
jgi:hypothetical protein